MGGRIASILTSEKTHTDIAGCICLGYPFHPPGGTEKLRTTHLRRIDTPLSHHSRELEIHLEKKEEVRDYDVDSQFKSHGLKMENTV